MSTQTAALTTTGSALRHGPRFSLCHFTTAHAQLKSRTFHRICLPLAQLGFRIHYISPANQASHYDGMDFTQVPAGTNFLGRIRQFLRVLRELIRQDAAIFHFQDPELLPVAFALKLLFARRVVYDAYEDFPSMAAASRSIPRAARPLAAALMRFAEWLAAHCFDALVTADPFTLRRLARTGKSRKLVFYNFPNLDFFPELRPAAKSFDVVYRGGLSDRAGTFTLLRAIQKLKSRSREPRVLLIGYFDDSCGRREIEECIRELDLQSNVEIRGRMDHEAMADALAAARVGVCPLEAVPKFLLNIPVKVFEYWACGLPVVSADLPPIRPFFHGSEAGLLCRPGDAVALSESIAYLLDHPEAAARMGARGRELAESRLNNHEEIHKLIRLFNEIMGPSLVADEEALAARA
jgi:glycosyltransferase involved in cell wall biosynthesis